MSRVMCKISEDWQITFADAAYGMPHHLRNLMSERQRRTFPVCFHLVCDEAQDNISGPFARQCLHGSGSSLELLVDAFDDVRGS